MKKVLLSFLMMVATMTMSVAGVIELSGNISSDLTLTRDKQYLLKGFVYVTSGTTLTIESGTIIKGDLDTKGTLVIKQGAYIIAKGTKDAPIIFTSNQAPGDRTYGDWGGVIICGYAPENKSQGGALPNAEGGVVALYGGNNAQDSSGVFQYVRIEYGGIAFSPDNEVNGLSLYAVGSKTVIDHVMISFSGDDSFEWFGGTVNAKYLISNRCWDDDFDTDLGFSGNVQFGIAWRDPFAADQSGSKAFESDNNANLLSAKPQTSCVFSNMTLVGPIQNVSVPNYDNSYVAAVQIRRNSALSLFNSVITGWPAGIFIDGPTTGDNLEKDSLFVQNNIIAGIQKTSGGAPREIPYLTPAGGGTQNSSVTNNINLASTDTTNLFVTKVGPVTWLLYGGNNNKKFTNPNDVRLANAYGNNYTGSPSFVPLTTSPIVYTNAANPSTPQVAPAFTNNKLSDPFFTTTAYVGAVGSSVSDWTKDGSWVVWNPQNLAYDGAVVQGVTNANALESMPMSVYPNPVSGLATVKFDLNNASELNISIVDMNGKVVSELPSASFNAGNNEVSFDASNLTNGIYVIKVSSDKGVKSAKFSVY